MNGAKNKCQVQKIYDRIKKKNSLKIGSQNQLSHW